MTDHADPTPTCPGCGGLGYTVNRYGPDDNVEQIQCDVCPLLDALTRERDELAEALDCQTGLLEDARLALSSCADRLDEHTYDELASVLDDGVADEHGRLYRSKRDAALADLEAALDSQLDWEGQAREALTEVARLREALADVTWAVMSEAELHRYGRPAYDMTLDHLYECASAARKALADPEESPHG